MSKAYAVRDRYEVFSNDNWRTLSDRWWITR